MEDTKNQGLDLHAELLKFYDKFYSSNIMSLCVVGKESVDELEAVVEEKFSSIVNKDASVFYGTVSLLTVSL